MSRVNAILLRYINSQLKLHSFRDIQRAKSQFHSWIIVSKLLCSTQFQLCEIRVVTLTSFRLSFSVNLNPKTVDKQQL